MVASLMIMMLLMFHQLPCSSPSQRVNSLLVTMTSLTIAATGKSTLFHDVAIVADVKAALAKLPGCDPAGPYTLGT